MAGWYLLLNLAEKDEIHLALFDETNFKECKKKGQNRLLLQAIEEFLTGQNVSKKMVQGIMVVVGAGSFTNTRIATTTANVFAYVQRIPVFAIGVTDVSRVQALIPELLRQSVGQYISATYSGEPNLGKKKMAE